MLRFSSKISFMSKVCRGIRGAITVDVNQEEDILLASHELLVEMLSKNDVDQQDIVSIFFSVTKDLDQAFPAKAARQMGLLDTPLLCLNEIDVENGLKKCIRLLMHVNSNKDQASIKHCYLKGAIILRPDLK